MLAHFYGFGHIEMDEDMSIKELMDYVNNIEKIIKMEQGEEDSGSIDIDKLSPEKRKMVLLSMFPKAK